MDTRGKVLLVGAASVAAVLALIFIRGAAAKGVKVTGVGLRE